MQIDALVSTLLLVLMLLVGDEVFVAKLMMMFQRTTRKREARVVSVTKP